MFPKITRWILVVLWCVVWLGCSAQKAEQATKAPSAAYERQGVPTDAVTTEDVQESSSRSGVLIGVAAKASSMPSLNTNPRPGESLLITVSSPYQLFKGHSTLLHVSAWYPDGRPASSADVFVGGASVGKTNKHGVLAFRYPATRQGARLPVSANIVSVIDTKNTRIQGHLPFRVHKRVNSFARDVLYVQTDRGVYAPGEQLHVRSIGWRLTNGYAPLVEKHLRVSLRSPEGQLIRQGRVTTDEFGVGAVSFQVPHAAKSGQYALVVQYKGARQEAAIQVRPFVRPSAQLTHDLPTFWSPKQRALVTSVILKDLNGRWVTNGSLSLDVRVSGQRLFILKQTVKGQMAQQLAASSAQVQTLQRRLKLAGKALLVLTWRGAVAGEVVTREHVMTFAGATVLATLSADKSQYTTQDPVTLVATLKDLQGRALVDEKVTLAYKSQAWVTQTNQRGVATWRVPMAKQSMPVVVKHKSSAQPLVKRTLQWRKARPMRAQMTRSTINQGAHAEVTVQFPKTISPVEQVVHVDMVDTTGAIVHSQLLPIQRQGGRTWAQGRLPASRWGTTLLTFYTLARSRGAYVDPAHPHHGLGVLTEGHSMIVYPNQKLTITLDGVPDVVEPGQVLNVRALVRDAQGRAVQASVGTSMVDHAVLSLLKTWRDPVALLYHSDQRAMTTAGARLLTWPVLSRNWGGQTHDIALPPFVFHGGGAVHKPITQPSKKVLAGMTPGRKGPSTSRTQTLDKERDEGGKKTLKDDRKPKSEANEDSKVQPDLLAKQPSIHIRTSFKHSYLWRPHLRAQGSVRFQIKMPDVLTSQQLTVVASDLRGGVGSIQKTIEVTKPVYAAVTFPSVVLANQRIWVPVTIHNQTPNAQTFKVKVESPQMGVARDNHTVKVAAFNRAVIWQPMTPKRPGRAAYLVSVDGAGGDDTLSHHVDVSPRGVEVMTPLQPQGKKKRLRLTITPTLVNNTPRPTSLQLEIAHPNARNMDVLLRRFDRQVQRDALGFASDLASAAALLRYARTRKMTSSSISTLHKRARAAASALSFSQHSSGAFAYWRNKRPSAFVTAWALDGLLETQELDVPTPQKTIRQAANWLAGQFGSGTTLGKDGIAYWEGSSVEVRAAIASEAYRVLSQVPRVQRTPKVTRVLARLDKHYLAQLGAMKISNPVVLANAILGATNTRVLSLSQPVSAPFVQRLFKLMAVKRWEPSWFRAYGGSVALRWAALQVLDQLPAAQQRQHRAYRDDLITQIFASQSDWGAWHNERETAAAIRALCVLGPKQGSNKPSRVQVMLNGKRVKKAVLSASSSGVLSMPLSWARPKKPLTVEVVFDGPTPRVQVQRRTWRVGQLNRASHKDQSLSVFGPKSTTPGQSVVMKLALKHAKPTIGVSTVHLSEHPGVELDESALAQAIATDSNWLRYKRTATGVVIERAPGVANAALNVAYTARTPGVYHWPTVRWHDLYAHAGKLSIKRTSE